MRAAGVLARFALGAMVLTTMAVVVDAPRAMAQTAKGGQDDSGISAGATSPGSSAAGSLSSGGGGASGAGGGTVATCTAADGTVGPVGYKRVPHDIMDEEQTAYAAEKNGAYHWRTCGGQLESSGGAFLAGAMFLPNGSRGAAAVVDPRALAQEALQRTPLPMPQISMAPDPSIPQLVNLPTFLWIPAGQWRPQTASASAGGVTSTVTATPERVVWDMGQGDTVVCDGPGSPYDPSLPDDAQPSDCTFTYLASSARTADKTFTVTATIEWHVRWSASGAPGGGDLGITPRSSTTTVRVAELQVLNLSSRP